MRVLDWKSQTEVRLCRSRRRLERARFLSHNNQILVFETVSITGSLRTSLRRDRVLSRSESTRANANPQGSYEAHGEYARKSQLSYRYLQKEVAFVVIAAQGIRSEHKNSHLETNHRSIGNSTEAL